MRNQKPQTLPAGMQDDVATLENAMEVLQKVKFRITTGSAILLPGIYALVHQEAYFKFFVLSAISSIQSLSRVRLFATP